MADDQTKVNENLFHTIIKLQRLSNEEGYDKRDCQKRHMTVFMTYSQNCQVLQTHFIVESIVLYCQ